MVDLSNTLSKDKDSGYSFGYSVNEAGQVTAKGSFGTKLGPVGTSVSVSVSPERVGVSASGNYGLLSGGGSYSSNLTGSKSKADVQVGIDGQVNGFKVDAGIEAEISYSRNVMNNGAVVTELSYGSDFKMTAGLDSPTSSSMLGFSLDLYHSTTRTTVLPDGTVKVFENTTGLLSGGGLTQEQAARAAALEVSMPGLIKDVVNEPQWHKYEKDMVDAIIVGDNVKAAKAAMKIDKTPGELNLTDFYQDGPLRKQAGYEDKGPGGGLRGGESAKDNGHGPSGARDGGLSKGLGNGNGNQSDTKSPSKNSSGGGHSGEGAKDNGHSGKQAGGGNGGTKSGGGLGGESAANNGHGSQRGASSSDKKSGEKNKPDHTATENRRPIILDLDGDGIQITELSRSTRFIDGGKGLLHKTAWAAAGNGVLFFDPDGRNAITEKRQYVFTDWSPTASGDIEALRAVWDSNGDGKLTAADTDFAKFKVLVTNADGSTTVQTLAQLNITEINLTADTTSIELPDGSMITGQTTFKRGNGTTGTVANTTLVAEAEGHRVVQATSTDGSGNKVVVSTAYDAAGAVVYVVTSVTNPAGTAIANSYDDNGDGVVDRDQTAATYFGDRCDGTPRLSVVHRQPFRGQNCCGVRRKGGRLAAHHECKRHLWRGQHVRQGRYRQYACDHLVLFREPHRSELGAHIDRLIGKHGQAA